MARAWIFAAIVVVAAGSVAAVKMRPASVTAVRVERGSAVDAVYASGTVECVDRADVKSRVAGPVDRAGVGLAHAAARAQERAVEVDGDEVIAATGHAKG